MRSSCKVVSGALICALAVVSFAGCKSKPKPTLNTRGPLEQNADTSKASPEELVRLGERHLAEGQTLEAFELALKARQTAPRSAAPHHLLGLLYMQVGEMAKARASFREAVRFEPTLLAGRLNLARLELAEHQPVAALQVLKDALKIHPSNAETWLLTGTAQHLRGSPQRAAASFRKAILLNPGLAEAHAAHGSLNLDLGSYQQAIPPLEKAYELGDRSPGTLIHLATALVAGRGNPADVQRAEALLREAGSSNTPSARLAAGLVHQQKGDYAAARGSYEAVLRTVPRHERALYGLGETLRAMGERERALETLSRYDRIVKQRQRLRTLEDRLNQEGDKPALLREYAVGLFEAEQYRQAAVHFRTWAAKAPGNPEPKQWLKRIRAKGVSS